VVRDGPLVDQTLDGRPTLGSTTFLDQAVLMSGSYGNQVVESANMVGSAFAKRRPRQGALDKNRLGNSSLSSVFCRALDKPLPCVQSDTG
jgi:hypothetical protein